MTATTLQLEEARFAKAIDRFLRRQIPSVVRVAVRKLAFDVASTTARNLNGAGTLPKRIDTGRLRAGWRVALADGGLPTTGMPGAATSQGGDGDMTETTSGGEVTITVTNRVEYAAHVEHGTSRMAPGKHLESALRTVRKALPRDEGKGSLPKGVTDAWGG